MKLVMRRVCEGGGGTKLSTHTVRVKDRWIFRDKTEWRANLFPRVRANTRVPRQRGVRALQDSAEGTFVNREQHEPHQVPPRHPPPPQPPLWELPPLQREVSWKRT